MRAIVQEAPGGPETLVWGEAPEPEVGPEDVLIRVFTTAFNPADVGGRSGKFLIDGESPIILGLECAGEIERVGASVTDWSVGDRVCALLNFGGYAELAAVPAAMVFPLPDELSFEQGAALPEALCTVWSNWLLGNDPSLVRACLIHGGSGSVGSIAIQIAKYHGHTVFSTAGSAAGLELIRRLGADHAISYRDQDFVAEVLTHTDGAGVDLILDTQGASYLERNVQALRSDGHLALIGIQGGANAHIDLMQLLRKRAIVTATMLKNRPSHGAHSKSEIVRQVRADLWAGVESGEIVPVIGAVISLKDVASVHDQFEAGSLPFGKTVLRVREEPNC